MRTIWQDVRYGMRMLRKSPGLVVAAVLCLGLGIGAVTTIFSVVNGALLRPFPYEKPDELALVWEQSSDEPWSVEGKIISHANFLDCKASSRTFQDMATISQAMYPMRYGDLFEPARTLGVTATLFDLLGVGPALGRRFLPEEEKKDHQQVVILTDECWRNWFRADSTHATIGRQTRHTHSVLAASQLALAFVLIVGAGLTVRTFANLLRIDPGFNPHNVLTMEMDFQRGNYDNKRVDALQDEFLNRVGHLPGVIAAATSNGLPLSNQGNRFLFDIEGDRVPSPDGYEAYNSWVSTDYFRTLGTHLLRGREFSAADRNSFDQPVVIINQALAQRFWPAGNPIGQRLKQRRGGSFEIIGVVENECYRDAQLTGKLEVSPRVYFHRYYSGYTNVTVRARTDPLSLAPAVKAVIRELDDQILVSRARSMESDLWEAFQLQRMTMLLVGVFAVFAFTLSVVGLYGVMAHSVRSRYREIAIRMAAGARPADILRMVLKQGVVVVVVGMGAGLAGMFALARVAASYVYGVAPMDALALGGAVLLLGVASTVACSLPARRAARIDPVVALRYE